jgi:hypothetical protein
MEVSKAATAGVLVAGIGQRLGKLLTVAIGVVLSGAAIGAPAATACCGHYVPPNPAESHFITDARNAGVVGIDDNIRSAGWMLCDSIWEYPNHEVQTGVLARLIQYDDLNQVMTLAQRDLCPHPPPW